MMISNIFSCLKGRWEKCIVYIDFIDLIRNSKETIIKIEIIVVECLLQQRGYVFIMICVMHIRQFPLAIALAWKHGHKKKIVFTSGLRTISLSHCSRMKRWSKEGNFIDILPAKSYRYMLNWWLVQTCTIEGV